MPVIYFKEHKITLNVVDLNQMESESSQIPTNFDPIQTFQHASC